MISTSLHTETCSAIQLGRWADQEKIQKKKIEKKKETEKSRVLVAAFDSSQNLRHLSFFWRGEGLIRPEFKSMIPYKIELHEVYFTSPHSASSKID